ncbi:MAG TPA: hypothetical protein PLK67_09265 [Bryobacteraceae bacterium]|nr:hypothetical protein [Bryobacteraceae bacterium]
MVSSVATDKMACRQKLQMFDHDPGATSAKLCSPDGGTTINYLDMREYTSLLVAAMLTVPGTGGSITKVEIVASADAAFTSPVVIKDSGAVAADATGDYVVAECTAEEIAQAGTDNGVDLRYAAARITMSANDAEACVAYLANPRYPQDGLTATTIA